MIIADRRETNILSCFTPYDCEVESTELDFGDFCFCGNGESGDITVGIERKKIRDLVNSMRDRRLGGFQGPGMAETYDVRYLVVEGIWQLGKAGELQELHGRDWRAVAGSKKQPVLWREVDSFFSSLEEFYGFRIKITKNDRETAAFVVSRYKYWQKPYNQHQTHKQVYAPEPGKGMSGKARFVSLEEQIRREFGSGAVLVWKMAAQIPGLDRKAELAARMFNGPEEMLNATVRDWVRAGVGPRTATTVWEALHP